jgi:hypothetical protein
VKLPRFFPITLVVAASTLWLSGSMLAPAVFGMQTPVPSAASSKPAVALPVQSSALPSQSNQAQSAQVPATQPNAGPVLPPPRPGFSFPTKQTLTYSVDWRVFPAATAVVHLEANGPTEHLTVNADTIAAINLLFHISDKFQSTFDRDKGCTTEFDKQTVEGRRQINSTLKLDYSKGKAFLDEKNLTTGQSKHLEAAIAPCLTDILTGVFYASSQTMEVGKSFDMPIVDLQKPVLVNMKVEAREELKTPAGTFKTVRIQPTAAAGIVKNRGQIWIWYSDDDRHLPVQMRARSFWGTITIRLASVESK